MGLKKCCLFSSSFFAWKNSWLALPGIFFLLVGIIFFVFIPFINKGNTGRKPNIIIICIDSLRADHLGCYGYTRNTSPRIDSLAKEGIVFENASSQSSFTRESVSVFLSGLLPSSSGSAGWYASPGANRKGMGDFFKEAGYRTGFFTANNLLDYAEFKKGFDEKQKETQKVSGSSLNLSNTAIDFITRNKEQKFMLYLHYLDPHYPYDPPVDYYKRFSPDLYPDPVGVFDDIRQTVKQLVKEGFGPGEDQFEDMVLRYDAEIAYTDYTVGLLLDKLKELDILYNTVILVTSDHGEEFLEHGYVNHAWTLFNEVTHIPLILWGGPISEPRRISQPVSSVYILPTVLSLFDIKFDRKEFDGHPLLSIKNGSVSFFPPAKPYIGELLIQHKDILRAVVKDNWKYISYIIHTEPENRPRNLPRYNELLERNTALHIDTWAPPKYEALYNLTADPGEKSNLIDSNPEKRDEFCKILSNYEMYCKSKSNGKSKQELKTSPLSPEELNKLKSLGYM